MVIVSLHTHTLTLTHSHTHTHTSTHTHIHTHTHTLTHPHTLTFTHTLTHPHTLTFTHTHTHTHIHTHTHTHTHTHAHTHTHIHMRAHTHTHTHTHPHTHAHTHTHTHTPTHTHTHQELGESLEGECSDFEAVPGRGLKCTVSGVEGYMGEEKKPSQAVTREPCVTPQTSLVDPPPISEGAQQSRRYQVWWTIVASLVHRPHPLREKGPGIHCLRMRLISQHSAAPAYHRVMSAVR